MHSWMHCQDQHQRGDVQVVRSKEKDHREEMKKLNGELEKALVDIHNSLAAGSGNRQKVGKDEKKRCSC